MSVLKPLIVKIPGANYAPEYLTPGREYEVILSYENAQKNCVFIINDDHGDDIECFLYSCPHIDYRNWEIVKSETI